MAAVSSPQVGVSGALTPPSSSHGSRGAWEYSVPVNHQTDPSANPKVSHSNDTPSYRQPLSSQTNGASLANHPSKTDLSERRTDAYDQYHSAKPSVTVDGGHLQPQRLNALGRKDSNISGVGSEADSVLDMYASPNRSGVGSIDYGDRKRANGDVYYVDDEDPEKSRWIHRDKLARIESQELQEAGIHIGRESRAGIRPSGKKDWAREHQSNGVYGVEPGNQVYPSREDLRQKIASPFLGEDGDEPISFDLRHPDEAAQDPDEENRAELQHTPIRQPGQKPSYSRIPVSKASPIPIPQDYIERHAPLQRTPGNPGNGFDDDGIAYNRTRSRSHSGGSQVLLDDGEDPNIASKSRSRNSPQGSPSKTKPATKGTSGGRKPSASRGTAGQQRPRTRSAQHKESTSPRPGTRSGETPPGSGNKRPEGDPPWLSSIYSPDPKLPPEQQLLPTVAKRLQQEQWEREGKYASEYDREFQPLKVHDTDAEPRPQVIEVPARNEDGSEWPLRSPKNSTGNGRPGTSGTATTNGGYSTMPSIQQPQGSAQNMTAKPIRPMRVQDPGEGKKPSGGCGCCIVM
ncbi:hypothetical protein FGG08_005466 [Glutinoglossum americanum]|uniref:TeaA receptor TeaR n=1 Tax=Glutinoglossum americanum TaxID=1670608 RepID=A0A9P8HUE8_9PEZI|nr:hypothetical protein FGG08_005466 [Glutinoglossum americanum]